MRTVSRRAFLAPLGQPTAFELVVNVKTAPARGIVVPPPLLLLRADRAVD